MQRCGVLPNNQMKIGILIYKIHAKAANVSTGKYGRWSVGKLALKLEELQVDADAASRLCNHMRLGRNLASISTGRSVQHLWTHAR